MGRCTICGKSAGLFKTQHKTCVDRNLVFSDKIRAFFVQALASDMPVQRFHDLVAQGCREHFIDDDGLNFLATEGVAMMIEAALADHVLTEADDRRITEFVDAFNVDTQQLELRNDALSKLIKAKVLRDLDNNVLKDRVDFTGTTAPNLDPGEVSLWSFTSATYLTQRSKTQFVGGSQGISIRLARGLYYRTGVFKGEPIRTDYLAVEAVGTLILASRNVYFLSDLKALKLPVKRIIAVNLHTDAIIIMAGVTTAKPHIFKIDDPPFAANVLGRLSETPP
jgi:hypothetical protein